MTDQSHAIFDDIQTLHAQFDHLETSIRENPLLGTVLFQGNPLDYYTSSDGKEAVFSALRNCDFDRVSLAHGIKRLRVNCFDQEVIWDYQPPSPKLVLNDPTTQLLEKNAVDIIREANSAIEFCSKFPDSDSLTNKEGLWSYRSFYDKLGVPNELLHSLCPRTSAVLRQLDLNLTLGFAFFSVLTSGTRIAAHKGSTSLRYRYHLGLKIPAVGRARIRVDDEWITWEEKKAFGFNDSFEHEVENFTPDSRAVLIIDTWSKHLPAPLVNTLKNQPQIFDFCILNRSTSGVALND